ncbi:MAG: InlB B-repeat-containing protein, partial [Clostridia bacterium]|nr:InlB B-repeat-containing protein [Clostridia bacterium]
MKRTLTRMIAIVMAAFMAFAVVPNLIKAGSAVKASIDSTVIPAPNGYIHTEMHGARAVSTAYENGDMETYYALTGATRDTLPSSYDSRNYNYITPVKDQNPYGSCWAHAAVGSVEAYMIKHGVPVGTGSAATTSLNLSETQHCFFNYSTAYDAEGMLTGDKCTLLGSDSCLDSGGNGEMSSYTLQRWCGAADESQSALAYGNASTVASSGLGSQYSYQYNVCHVQNSEWIPGTDIEGIKRAIMEYGAGNISYYAGSSYSTYTNTYQCVIDTSSQDSSSHKWANHAITVVGWDDTIAKSNFKPNTPSSNGAWLCKNSWGTGYFNSGYMWISYEDTSVGEGYLYFYDAEAIDNYDHNYQYDGSCNVVTYGVGNRVGFANNTKVANVFTAQGSELLQAVALCNWDEALSYTVEIYKNPTTGNPSSGTLMSSQTGSITYSGYYTIVLDTPVLLSQGDTFSVVFTQSCPTADESGKYIHTPYDANFNDTSIVSWASWTHTNHGNTSYYQEPNGAWTDCPDNGDYRIKAYTIDYENPYTVTAVSNNNSYGTVSVTGNVITATPAAGYYVESCTVTAGTATYTINGNTITVNASSDCTIRVNFAPKPQYTVNFIASGTAQGSQTAYVQDAITLPNSVSVNPDGWTFIGWVEAQIDETEVEPTYYAPGASYTVNGNATLYALYNRVEGGTGNETVYELVTAAPSDWAGNYVITNNTTNISSAYVLKGVTGSSSGTNAETASNCTAFANTGITYEDGVLRNVPSDYVMIVAANGSYYTIKAPNNTYYGMNSSSYLYSYSTLNSTYCLWTPGINSNGVAQFKNKANGSYPYFSWSTSNSYFWSGSSNNANVLRLYKEHVINTDTTYYATDPVVAQPTYYTVTFKDWDGTTLKTEEVLEGAAATAPADPTRVGYTFTGWDVDFSNVTADLVVTAQYQINTYTVIFKDWD